VGERNLEGDEMEFETPVMVPAGSDSSQLELKSLADVEKWASAHVKRWDDAAEPLYRSEAGDRKLLAILQGQSSQWREWIWSFLLKGAKSSGDVQESIREKLARKVLLIPDEPIVSRALGIMAEEPAVARFLLKIASDRMEGEIQSLLNSPESLYDCIRAMVLLTSTAGYAAMAEKSRESSEQAIIFLRKSKSEHDKVSAEVNDAHKRLEAGIAAVMADAEKQLASADLQWKKLHAIYDASLKLEAPRKYWDSKRQAHADLAVRWRKAFAACAGLGSVVIAVAVLTLPQLGRYAKDFDVLAWVIPAAVLGIPVFLVLWLLRICGRQWSDHLIRMEDARERVVMVETFLALSRSDDSPNSIADAGHLSIVLGALFRAGPGLSHDDAPPVGALDLALSRLGGSKSA
jgi:hypothetical protein